MKKYTANYAFTNPNFVIQNLVENEVELPEKSLLYVLKNILQRGFPTLMSEYLRSKIGYIEKEPDFRDPFLLVGLEPPRWIATIKGDEQNDDFPAREFLEVLIPKYFGDYAFVQSLLLPEARISDIVGAYNADFVNQQVDFYLPQAKLVIEIDGQQHKTDDLTRISDQQRDNYLISKGIKTIRISTRALRNGSFVNEIDQILHHLGTFNKSLSLYKIAYDKFKEDAITQAEVQTRLMPTAIIRFQILLIELLLNDYLNFGAEWKFNLLLKKEEQLNGFAELAIEDFFIWFEHLYRLKEKQDWKRPAYQVNYAFSANDFDKSPSVLNIDFSILSRWTDLNNLHPHLLFVRTDYFGAEKNYFSVSCTDLINYEIKDEDIPTLKFFLRNIFGKPGFREGQFPIIANVLNREDTIGLLPTGGGKSLCYQLPCLLQPSVNFVVCPIKSLMYDQYENLKNSYITNTNFITSDLSAEEKRQVQEEFSQGKYLFIWISPERFQIKRFREYIAAVNAQSTIAYAVIDEVHCLSEWGHDFRTSYLNLAKTIERYCPGAKYVGLTATASVNVLKDIRVEFARNNRVIRDENIKSLLDYSRKELVFEVIRDNNNKLKLLKGLIQQEGILEQSKKAALVFTPHVNGHYGCYTLSNKLNQGSGKVTWYAGDVPKVPEYDENGNRTEREIPVMDEQAFDKHKNKAQHDFKTDKCPLLVATKAFGMGIDKQNIHYTFHYGLPGSVEALYQEAGRAGRWDSAEMAQVKAHCYVLYSQETTDPAIIQHLFEKNTTFAEIKAINQEVGWEGKDVFRQIFLFLQGQRDPADEFKVIQLLLDNYFKPFSKENIYFGTIERELKGIGFKGTKDELVQLAQKGIYRLRILGMVRDWTTDFVSHYEVEFLSMDEKGVFEALFQYVSKYKPNIKLKEELEKLNRKTFQEKCIWYLLQWTFDNITYNRKQTLKTLSEWCDGFEKDGNEVFKGRIDNYFRFTDTTFIFQHIGEHPEAYGKWFEIFYRIDLDEEGQKEIRTFIPSITDEGLRQTEFERLRDSLSRFLESYLNNVGLDFISGLIRLFLNDYENPDGRIRFMSALAYIESSFSKEDQDAIMIRLMELGSHLNEAGKENLCISITAVYPNELERIAAYFDLLYLLDDRISIKVQQLKRLNKKLHERFEQIGTI